MATPISSQNIFSADIRERILYSLSVGALVLELRPNQFLQLTRSCKDGRPPAHAEREMYMFKNYFFVLVLFILGCKDVNYHHVVQDDKLVGVYEFNETILFLMSGYKYVEGRKDGVCLKSGTWSAGERDLVLTQYDISEEEFHRLGGFPEENYIVLEVNKAYWLMFNDKANPSSRREEVSYKPAQETYLRPSC